MAEHPISFSSLVIIATLAFFIPLAIHRIRFLRIPVVVGELIAGIVIGKSGFDIVSPEPWLAFLATLGITYLMFLSGVEIDFRLLTRLSRQAEGRRLFLTTAAYFVAVLSLAVAAGYGLRRFGLVEDPFIIALILTTCSVGVVLPTIKEKRLAGTEYGQAMLLTALLMDFATMLLLAVLVTFVRGGSLWELALITLLFLAVFVAYLGSERLRQKPFMQELAHATSQIGVRGAFMLIFILAYLANLLGVEIILGAFLAGAIVSLFARSDETSLHMKLDAIGFGFLVPVFFIMVGAEFDAASLMQSPRSLLLAPVIILLAYAAKVVPAAFFAGRYGGRKAAGLGVLVTPGLSLTVAAAEIGFRLGLLDSSTHSAMILLAIVTAALSPLLFERLVPGVYGEDERRRLVIVGANERGLVLAARLADLDPDLLLLDRDQARVKKAQEKGFRVMQADVTDPQVWRAIDPTDMTTVLVATQNDALNSQIAELLRTQFNVGAVIAQVNDASLAERLQGLDVRAITPAFSTLSVMENIARHPDLFAILNQETDRIRIKEVIVRSPKMDGVRIRELALPGDSLILAIRRGREHVIPRGDTRLRLGDVLTLAGAASDLEDVGDGFELHTKSR